MKSIIASIVLVLAGTGCSAQGDLNSQGAASSECELVAKSVISLNYNDAMVEADESGFSVRRVSIDGEHRAVISNYDPDRVNLHMEKGVVVRATCG